MEPLETKPRWNANSSDSHDGQGELAIGRYRTFFILIDNDRLMIALNELARMAREMGRWGMMGSVESMQRIES